MGAKNKVMLAMLKRKLVPALIGLAVLAAIAYGGYWVYVNYIA